MRGGGQSLTMFAKPALNEVLFCSSAQLINLSSEMNLPVKYVEKEWQG